MESQILQDLEINSETVDVEQSIYYAVYIPSDVQEDVDPHRCVFKDKHVALGLAKTFKKSRFKAFVFYHEAVDFAVDGQTLHESTQDVAENFKENIQVGEKPVAFRGPKSQDLVKLRKAIENGALAVVETTIWDNPRYLISSGDTPSILQEGSRYNAMHVAAKCKNREMCELILNTVSDVNFVKLLYGDDENQDLNERSKILLDLYLNTPDKGLNETPLHFAVKFGAVEVVELLVSYPQCDKNVKNKFGKLPNQIICERCESASLKIKNKMAMLLQDAFYVPVLRAEHNCAPPVIGEPFAPNSPLIFSNDPLLPRLEIHAYAGPMSKETADKFRKVWKTPPRSLRQLRSKDLEKGLETVGRNLAEKHEVDWKEYWPFLDDFVDISSLGGLDCLEKYFATRIVKQYADEIAGNENNSTGSTILSPVSELCKDLEACTLSENNRSNKCAPTSKALITDNPLTYKLLSDELLLADINPSVCIEKTCEVFAYRISNNILNLLESHYNKITYELLEIDITQLENVIVSFMADPRFNQIDYQYVHHRVACCIVTRLQDFLLIQEKINFMKKSIQLWLEMCSKEFDYFSSDDECGHYRPNTRNLNSKKRTPKNKQVICLLQHILSVLVAEDHSNTYGFSESESVQAWAEGKPCDCVWTKPAFNKRSANKLTRNFVPNKEDGLSRRLFDNSDLASPKSKNDCDTLNKSKELSSIQVSDSEEDGDIDSYYTALNSPSCSDSGDVFEDSFTLEEDIFIEGSVPTKMDCAVYNALNSTCEKLNPNNYPNIYKWYHAVNLYPESERQNWGSSSVARCRVNSQTFTSTPQRGVNAGNGEMYHSPSSPWLRRIGLASPKNSLKEFKPNISFNL